LGLKPQVANREPKDTTHNNGEMIGSTEKNRAKALQWQFGPKAPFLLT
jgi:hypothetical protein